MTTQTRTQKLTNDLNNCWNDILSTKDIDYFSKLTIADLLKLKVALSNIHNDITLKLTETFIDSLQKYNLNFISPNIWDAIRTQVNATNANTNGYDVQWEDPAILAEVKANIPVNGGDTFGAQQKVGILNDITSLLNGKQKVTLEKDISKYMKFIVMLDTGKQRAAMHKLITNANISKLVEEYVEQPLKDLALHKVYIVYISI